MTKGQVSQLVAILMACYPNARFPEATIVAYENFLIDLDHDLAQRAIKNLVLTTKFVPTIAEIVSTHDSLKPQLSVSERIAAEERARVADRAARGLPPLDDGSETIHDPAELDRILARVGGPAL